MDPNTLKMFMAAPIHSASEPSIGDSYGGGFFVGYYSSSANGVATHRLICAPKSTGCGGSHYGQAKRVMQTTGTAVSGTNFYDGASNTALYSTSNSPIVSFITGLSLGGYTDWYLPAQLEYEIAYYNLKPRNVSNNTGRGINDYSVPKRTSNYTSTDPAQTSLSAWQYSSGAEHFAAESTSSFDKYHISSTQRFGGNNWAKDFNNGRLISANATSNSFSYCAFRKDSV